MISKSYIIKNTNKFFGFSLLIVLAIACIFAVIHKVIASAVGLNYFEYLIEIFTSQKMFLYLIFLFYIFAITKVITVITNQELIRFGSFSRYTINFFLSIIFVVSMYVFLFIFLYSVTGLGLSFENSFESSTQFYSWLAEIDFTPVTVLVISVFHMILFLVTVTMILKTIFTLFDYKVYIVSVVMSFVLMIHSAGSSAFQWIFEFESYSTLFNAYYYLQDNFYYYYLIEISVIVICFLLLKFKWNRQIKMGSKVK